MGQPLLSICVPTFNRAPLLRLLLASLVREAYGLGDRLEIVVSDNASTDDTPDVVASVQADLPLKYSRNPTNLGVAANIDAVVGLAAGTYCWIVGDDALFAEGAVGTVIQLLDSTPGIPAVVVGYSYVREEARFGACCDPDAEGARSIFNHPERPAAIVKWEETCYDSRARGLHTAIVGCVFSRDLWSLGGLNHDELLRVEPLSTLESTCPHTVVWVRTLTGKDVLFAPKPLLCFFVGSQGWFDRCWPTINFSFCLNLAELMRAKGGIEGPIRYYEGLLLSASGLDQLVCAPNEYAQRHFSLAWLISKYGHRKELIAGLELGERKLEARLRSWYIRRILSAVILSRKINPRLLRFLGRRMAGQLVRFMESLFRRLLNFARPATDDPK